MWRFDCLSDYTALIQLLVGSVFFANYFSNNETLFEEDVKSLLVSFKSKVYYINHYIPRPSKEWKTEWFDGAKKQRKSLMFVLAIYGCLVLFYCANCYHSCCGIQQHISTFGLGLSTCMVFLFLVFMFVFYGKHEYKSWHTHLEWLVMLLCVICFVFSYFPIVSFFDRISDWVNRFVLINLVIWSGIYIKQFAYIWIVRKKIKELKKSAFELYYSKQLKTAFSLSEKLQCVFKWLEENKDVDERNIIIELCVSELKEDNNYIRMKKVPVDDNPDEFQIEQVLLNVGEIEDLKNKISIQKALDELEKNKLINNIKNSVTVSVAPSKKALPKNSDKKKDTLQTIVDTLYIHGFDVRKTYQD